MLPGLCGVIGGVANTRTPELRGAVTSSQQSTGTTFAATIPTHQSGDVLLVVVAYVNSAATSAAGWTKEAEIGNSAANGGIAIYSLTATGSAHTISVANSNNLGITAHAYVLWFAQGDVEATGATGHDPPSETTLWGAASNFWVAAHETLGNAPSAGPSGFTNSVQTTNGSLFLTTLQKADASATLDPSTFTSAGAAGSAAALTIAVRPA